MTVYVEERPRKIPALAAVAAGLVGTGAIVALLHLDHLNFTFCTFKRMTGYPCITCGTTRALGRLAVGDLSGALHVNPLATVAMLALLALAVVDLGLLSRGRSFTFKTSPAERRWLAIVLGVLVLVNWAYLIATGV